MKIPGLVLWEKFTHPLVWPVDLGPPERLLVQMATKYNQEQEVIYAAEQVEEGLEEIEQWLVEGPMARRGCVLDVGCGAGREAVALARLGYQVVGIDIASRMVEAAQHNAAQRGLEIVFMTLAAQEVTPQLGSFDYVLTTPGFYQCVPTRTMRVQTLRALSSALKPAGILFLSAPWYVLWGRAGYRPGLRAKLVDGLRYLHRVLPGEHFTSEPGDQLLRTVSPVSDPTVTVFQHLFYKPAIIAEEIRRAGLSGEPIQYGMWNLRKTIGNEEPLF